MRRLAYARALEPKSSTSPFRAMTAPTPLCEPWQRPEPAGYTAPHAHGSWATTGTRWGRYVLVAGFVVDTVVVVVTVIVTGSVTEIVTVVVTAGRVVVRVVVVVTVVIWVTVVVTAGSVVV